MFIFKEIADLRHYLDSTESSLGFVPTMGALHQGHISLIERSKTANQVTICSIFVNPAQFNDPSDYQKYPVTLEKDIQALSLVKTDILFLPEVDEMYPEGNRSSKNYNLGYLDTILDGEFRPGHFNGVCTIVEKLLKAVKPTRMYLGEKDFQQCLVLKRLIEIMKSDVEIITCATQREPNGLAMSSRNERLSKAGREKASAIYYTLHSIKEDMKRIPFSDLQDRLTKYLDANAFETEYLLLADAKTLELLNEVDTTRKMVVLIAARLEGVRLIDNLRLN